MSLLRTALLSSVAVTLAMGGLAQSATGAEEPTGKCSNSGADIVLCTQLVNPKDTNLSSADKAALTEGQKMPSDAGKSVIAPKNSSRSVEAKSAVQEAPQPLCLYSAQSGELRYDRFNVCHAQTQHVDVFQLRNNRLEKVGSFYYNFWAFTLLSRSDKLLVSQWMIHPFGYEGQTSGTRMSATATCSSDCTVAAPNSGSYDISTENYYKWQVDATSKVASGKILENNQVTWASEITRGTSPPSTFTPLTTTVRCDSETPGNSGSGCVVEKPTTVPSITYYKSDKPEYYGHIWRAFDSGLPSRLHRMVDSTLANRNTAKACPGGWTRPSGKQCDEYPPKSTYEGAYTAAGKNPDGTYKGNAIGRTYQGCSITQLPGGSVPGAKWSSCMINSTQNASAGGQLGNLYVSQRILNTEAFYIYASDQ